MHIQDLRDSKYERQAYFSHKRGWFDSWRWEYCIAKNPFNDIAKFKVCLGGEDDRQVQFIIGLFGLALYLTFHKLLPERWAIGWYKRGETKNPNWEYDHMGRTYGFYMDRECFNFSWSKSNAGSGRDPRYGYSYHYFLPWTWGGSVRHQVLGDDGLWRSSSYEQAGKARRKAIKAGMPQEEVWKIKDEDFPDHRKMYTADYTYTRKSGEIQKRIATFYVEEREWRWKMFHRLPFRFGPKRVRRSISIQFDDEVGEGTGSWKGGTIGCSYSMKNGETPMACLRRMEVERKF